MSKYTTELRFICEQLAGLDESEGYNSVATIVETARPKIFDFDFPIFDEDYRSVLETKIIRHYYLREIGAETYGVFKLFLENTLNEIMPYYNKLYESANLEYNPLYDVNYYREHEGEKNTVEDNENTNNSTLTLNTRNNKTGTDTTEYDALDWSKFHDTPQGAITGLDNDNYMTNARKDTKDDETNTTYNSQIAETGTRNTESSGTEDNIMNTTDQYVTHIYGKSAYKSYATLIEEYRKTLINIDIMIINELNDCFMLLY